MICPFCGANKDKVIDSRSSEGGAVVRRRRQCIDCERRFTTYERVEETPARLMVIKRDKTRQPFDRAKIEAGVRVACGKRPVGAGALERLVDHVEDAIYREHDREVESRVIGEMVANRLRDLDEIAFVRFGCDYYQFKNVGDVMKQIEDLAGRVRDVKDQQRLFPDGSSPESGEAARRSNGSAGGGES